MNIKYNRAIVRPPGKTYVNCLRQSKESAINIEKAIKQHDSFCEKLSACNVDVVRLPVKDEFPDGCFVEDTMVVLQNKAIVCRLKELSRRGEEEDVQRAASDFIRDIHRIDSPGILEGGDVILTSTEIFIGCGGRSNIDGVKQFMEIMTECVGVVVTNYQGLHLKSVCAYIGNDTFVLDPLKIDKSLFRKYRIILVEPQESYAANCIGMNNYVFVPKGFPKLNYQLEKLGFQTCAVDVSEFRKGDAGITCLAVLF